MNKIKFVIASDHAGYLLKEEIKEYFKKQEIEFIDCGTENETADTNETADNSDVNEENTDSADAADTNEADAQGEEVDGDAAVENDAAAGDETTENTANDSNSEVQPE